MSKEQRTNEWENLDSKSLSYHSIQWGSTKRSTIHFSEFIKSEIQSSHNIIDLGCGSGSSTYYVSNLNPNCNFIGIDFNLELINIGNNIIKDRKIKHLQLLQDDIYNLNEYIGIDGVISLQTLSWLPDFKEPLVQIMTKLKPKWMCFSSLFYEGEISIKTEVYEHKRRRATHYNVYSIPIIDKFINQYGYRVETYSPFKIDIDLKRPDDNDLMGTYTKTFEKERIQFSGPLLMPWYFVKIVKS